MVFMRMGRDDPEQMVAALGDKARVGHHDLEPRLRIVAEGDAAIDDQPLTGTAVEAQIHADLVGAAERHEIEPSRIVGPGPGNGAGRQFAHRSVFLRWIRRSPHKVRSGSTVSMTSIAVAKSGAKPPVAMTPIASPRSSRMRRTSPSTSPT